MMATASEIIGNRISPKISSGCRKPVTGPAMMPPASRNSMAGMRIRQAAHWQIRDVTPIPARIRVVLTAINGFRLVRDWLYVQFCSAAGKRQRIRSWRSPGWRRQNPRHNPALPGRLWRASAGRLHHRPPDKSAAPESIRPQCQNAAWDFAKSRIPDAAYYEPWPAMDPG